MSDIRKPEIPTLHSLLLELIHVQSALNMPTPREAPPELVEHAHEHLEEAIRQLTVILERPGKC